MVDTSVTLSGWQLDNPVIPASGTFGYGKEFSEFYDINILGTFSFKGTTVLPRYGNPLPRIAESDAGVINSIGLQNNGMEHVIAHELPEMKNYFHKKVIANVSGFSVEDYVTLCERFGKEEQVGLIEVNVSCPNVEKGGLAFGTSPENVYEVTKAVKAVTYKPVYIKLSPNVTDIVSLAKACEEGGADGVSLINTLTGMRIDLKTRKPVNANKIAGYAGKGLYPAALAMVYKVYEAVKIPIIGMGGVSSAENVIEMMLAGATAVQVGTANLINPFACKEIIEKLPDVMKKYKIEKLKDIIGGAHDGN
ncbi:MAG: dihydroorotate dehydrogenase [Eubacteriales bacterium]|nr:dihydroorotate dehydrogenase [Eubacteriales bacterium]